MGQIEIVEPVTGRGQIEIVKPVTGMGQIEIMEPVTGREHDATSEVDKKWNGRLLVVGQFAEKM
jgi:hypothetical protein